MVAKYGIDLDTSHDAVLGEPTFLFFQEDIGVVAPKHVIGTRERAECDARIFLYDVPGISGHDDIRTPSLRLVTSLR